MLVRELARLAGLRAGLAVRVESGDHSPVVDFPYHIILDLPCEAIMIHGKISNDDISPAGHVFVIFFWVDEGKTEVSCKVQSGGAVIRLGPEANLSGDSIPLEDILPQVPSLGFFIVLDLETHDGLDGVVGAAFDGLQERRPEVYVPHLVYIFKVPSVPPRLPPFLPGPSGCWAEVPPVVAVAV